MGAPFFYFREMTMSNVSTNIINRALIKLGQPPVASVDQEPNGKLWGLIYLDQRDLLLADFSWRFAMKRAVLAPDADKPISGFAYAYTLPTDFISVFKVGQYYKTPNYSSNIVSSDEAYSIEGDKILCNIPDKLYLQYTARIEEERLFSPWFKEALITKVAAEMAMRTKQNIQLQQMLSNDFASYLEHAEFNDEIMRDAETIPDGSWVGIREGWSNEY